MFRFLATTFLIASLVFAPLFTVAQEVSTTTDNLIPVLFFLHHTDDTALGILAVMPFNEQEGVVVHQPLATSTNSHTLLGGPTSSSGNGSNTNYDGFIIGQVDQTSGSSFTPTSNWYMDGLIDDVRVYNAVISTSTMNTHNTELEGNESDLVLEYS